MTPTYGKLTPPMEALLAGVVRGKHVWDLGAGNGELTRRIVGWGASHVTAVEKDRDLTPKAHMGSLTWLPLYFEQARLQVPPEPGGIDVAFVSWPQNTPLYGLVELLGMARTVVYVGSNTDGNACGWPELFMYFKTRKVLHQVPDRRNSMTVYGAVFPQGAPKRAETHEELAVLSRLMLSFEDALGAANLVRQTVRGPR